MHFQWFIQVNGINMTGCDTTIQCVLLVYMWIRWQTHTHTILHEWLDDLWKGISPHQNLGWSSKLHFAKCAIDFHFVIHLLFLVQGFVCSHNPRRRRRWNKWFDVKRCSIYQSIDCWVGSFTLSAFIGRANDEWERERAFNQILEIFFLVCQQPTRNKWLSTCVRVCVCVSVKRSLHMNSISFIAKGVGLVRLQSNQSHNYTAIVQSQVEGTWRMHLSDLSQESDTWRMTMASSFTQRDSISARNE